MKYTTSDVAKLCGVSYGKIYYAQIRKRIPQPVAITPRVFVYDEEQMKEIRAYFLYKTKK